MKHACDQGATPTPFAPLLAAFALPGLLMDASQMKLVLFLALPRVAFSFGVAASSRIRICVSPLRGKSGTMMLSSTSPSSSLMSSLSPTFDVFPLGTEINTQQERATKIVHFIRHAEGTHNVNQEYRSKINLDAPLTEKGRQQCQELAQKIATAQQGPLFQLRESAEIIVTSPLTRCIQTATLSFPSLLEKGIPMVAHEMVRETVNYNCDRRRTIQQITKEHAHIDYSHVNDNHDVIWDHYEKRFGCDETYTGHRESGEIHTVAERGRSFFEWLAKQPYKHVVVCTHSAFLRCIKNYGNNPEEGPLGVPLLPPQHGQPPEQIVPVLNYKCDVLAQQMRQNYENCELRSFLVAY